MFCTCFSPGKQIPLNVNLLCRSLKPNCWQSCLGMTETVFGKYFGRQMAIVPIIKIPARVQNKLEKIKARENRSTSKPGKREDLVISCRRKKFNHFKGQTYGKLEELPLVSRGWNHNKAKGDYFSINTLQGNPSIANREENVEENTFANLGLEEEISRFLCSLGCQVPTQVQSLSIPAVLKGFNSIVAAETGSGKTLCFLAPLVQQILRWKQEASSREQSWLPETNSPHALVLVPGRELAEQIATLASAFGRRFNFRVKLLVGGSTAKQIKTSSAETFDLLVATVGVVRKFTAAGVYNMSQVKHIVMDEADTLLDDSFNQEIVKYLRRFTLQTTIPDGSASDDVQLTLVGATMPRSLAEILDDLVPVASFRKITTPHLHRILPHIHQKFIRLGKSEKPVQLLELVKFDVESRVPVLVFSNKSSTCDWISLFLNERGIHCTNLHGGLSQLLRRGRFDQYQSGEVNVLSCTDIASRGLDTLRTGHVINYEFPLNISDYIHRCGRIGRVGSLVPGHMTNFICGPMEVDLVQKIEHSVRKVVALPNVNANIKRLVTARIFKKNPNSLLGNQE